MAALLRLNVFIASPLRSGFAEGDCRWRTNGLVLKINELCSEPRMDNVSEETRCVAGDTEGKDDRGTVVLKTSVVQARFWDA
jgi:hypothetical protein